MKNAKHYIKLFKKAKTETLREKYLASWTMAVFMEFNNLSQNWRPQQNQVYFERLDQEAQKFCSKPIHDGEWCLNKKWLRTIIAYLGRSINTQKMFEILGWNYQESLNPKSDESHIIREYSWVDSDKVDGTINPFVLKSRGHIPTGSKWQVGNGKVKWTVQFSNDNTVEIINQKHTLVRKIHRKDFVKNYSKVG